MAKGSPCYRCKYARFDYYLTEVWLVDCEKRQDLSFNPDLVDECPFSRKKKRG